MNSNNNKNHHHHHHHNYAIVFKRVYSPLKAILFKLMLYKHCLQTENNNFSHNGWALFVPETRVKSPVKANEFIISISTQLVVIKVKIENALDFHFSSNEKTMKAWNNVVGYWLSV